MDSKYQMTFNAQNQTWDHPKQLPVTQIAWKSLVLFHCYSGPHYLLREPDLPLLWCFSPSCPDRKSNTLNLHKELSKNQAVLTSLNFWISHLWTSQCVRGKALLLARGFLREVGVLAQITVPFAFPPFAGCLLSPKRTHCIRCCGKEYKAWSSSFQDISGK